MAKSLKGPQPAIKRFGISSELYLRINIVIGMYQNLIHFP